MAVIKHEVASLDALVGLVLSIRRALPDGAFLWYRGLNCAYPLLPKLLRDGKSMAEVDEREIRLLTRFRERGLAYWPAGYQQTDWDQLFALQHFGGPTRLLDWTENLFVAAYFALDVPAAHSHTCQPTIWCMDPVLWNQSTHLETYGDSIGVLTTVNQELESYRPLPDRKRPRHPVALYGAHNSQRIVAQRGTFVVWGSQEKALEAFADDRSKELLWQITLTGDRVSLRRDLHVLGFGETTVFPELAYLASEIARMEGW